MPLDLQHRSILCFRSSYEELPILYSNMFISVAPVRSYTLLYIYIYIYIKYIDRQVALAEALKARCLHEHFVACMKY